MEAICEIEPAVNVGNIDRIVRAVMGCGLLALTLGHVGEVGYVGLPALISFPILMSALTGWDPLYALLELDLVTFSDNEPETESPINRETMHQSYQQFDVDYRYANYGTGGIATA